MSTEPNRRPGVTPDAKFTTEASGLTQEALRGRPEDFLVFLREHVSIGALLQDREGQAGLDRIMQIYFHRDEKFIQISRAMGVPKLKNPYPELTLESSDGGLRFIHGAFHLRDNTAYYYFPTGYPMKEVPDFLRPQDVIESKFSTPTYPQENIAAAMKDLGFSDERVFRAMVYNDDPRMRPHQVWKTLSFNKPICRVPILGGTSELYNYRSSEWEPSGDGVYSPSFAARTTARVRGARPLPETTSKPAITPGQ